MTLTNLLYTLELANLPLRSRDRPDDAPIVVAGGAGAFRPEVLGAVVDAVTPGDAAEIVVPLLRLAPERRRPGVPRPRLLRAVTPRVPLVVLPSLADAKDWHRVRMRLPAMAVRYERESRC